MRILMLVHSLRRGGAERVLLEIALGLQRRGHEVEVVSWLDVDEYQEDRYKAVLRHYLLPEDKYRWVRSIPRSAASLRKVVEQFNPDVIEIHTPNVAWLAAGAGLVVPCAHTLHSYSDMTRYGTLKNEFIRYLSRFVAWRLKSSFITVSDSMIPFAARYFKADEERFRCVSNGIDLEKFCFVPKLPDNSPVIVMIGTLSPNKGQAHGIRAFKAVLDKLPNVRLLIIGDGVDSAALEELVKVHGLEHQVELLGQRHDVSEILTASHLLWQLSEIEAMPIVVLEAMAAGLPVIGFDARGTRDAVVQNKTGILAPYGDTASIANMTVALLKDRSRYQNFSFSARLRVDKLFSLESMVDGHELALRAAGKH
ncbi:MAG: glycosyltransferase family 4 protein [Pseudomonadota bacterium]